MMCIKVLAAMPPVATVKGMARLGKYGHRTLRKVRGMKTAATNMFKASLACVAGWAIAGWMLFLLMALLALFS